MSTDEAGNNWCHLCGRPLVCGVCPHCDRRAKSWPNPIAAWVRCRPIAAWVRRRPARWSAATAVLLAAIVLAAFGFGWFRTGRSAHPPTGPVPATSASPTSAPPANPADRPLATLAAPSTFEVLSDEMDIFGNRARRGYAFVIHTGSQTSDLLTDYYMIAQAYMQGVDTVDLQRGDQTFTARVVAVGSDSHVALLRISGTYPVLPISAATPKSGDTVTVGETTSSTPRRTAVVAYSGADGASHLTFSVEVSNVDDGLPVLDSAGRVVGIAEPTSLYRVGGVGYAVPILRACQSVGAC
jgi:hypothetical protein